MKFFNYNIIIISICLTLKRFIKKKALFIWFVVITCMGWLEFKLFINSEVEKIYYYYLFSSTNIRKLFLVYYSIK